MENGVLEREIESLCERAKEASLSLMTVNIKTRNAVLTRISEVLTIGESIERIMAANAVDIKNAASNGISEVMVDRLRLDAKRIGAIAAAVKKIVNLPDPLGRGEVWTPENGLSIRRVRVPIGVVGIIYESRPNVTVDAAALALKSGNATVLRGGKEAINTNIAVVGIIQSVLGEYGLSPACVSLISDTSREGANIFMRQSAYVDVLIPRGGAELIKSAVNNAKMPVIETGAGNCHIYVDESADFELAAKVITGSKRRPSVCNAVETILVNDKIYQEFLPIMAESLEELKVEIRGCPLTLDVLPNAKPASDDDFYKEYNDYILSVKVLPNVTSAVSHINKHSTRHSDAIITRDMQNAEFFCAGVDSAAVYVNASTRFTDGEEFGFGAEIGISTSKIHARGPMGANELTTIKYIISGSGQTR